MPRQRMSDIVVRPPSTREMPRVRHFFANEYIAPEAQVVVAVKSQPVERFVGALAGWLTGEYGQFMLACLPGSARHEAARALIQAIAESARAAGLRHLLYGKLLAEHDPGYELLQENSFSIMRSERFFQVAVAQGANRVKELMQRYQSAIPANWHTEAIRGRPPEDILDLISPHRLMAPEEVRARWQWEKPDAYEPDLSGIIYDGKEAFGAFLVRQRGDSAICDVRVVNHPDPRLSGLANLCLYHHSLTAENRDQSKSIRWVVFRGGEKEHLETVNMARRMGASEMPIRHSLGLAL